MRNRCIPAFQVICFVMAVSVGPAQADIIHVPADQPTIQAGIDAASNGDTVLVADGTYTGPGNRDIDFLGKAITVRSEYGPGNCIIDAEGSETDQRRCFIFQNSEGRDSVLQGFTIRGGDMGDWEFGGGIRVGGSPTIIGNVITANRAYIGGGIHTSGGSPLIAGNLITGNLALDYIDDIGAGGSICCWEGTAEICGNIIQGNTSAIIGGGIWLAAGNPQVVNNLIVGNLIQQENDTDPYPSGAGIACDWTYAQVANCTIAGNRIEHALGVSFGGGICLSPPRGYDPGPGCDVTVVNSVIYGNEADFGGQCHLGDTSDEASTLTIHHCDLEGGQADISGDGILYWGAGMIDADPLFTAGSLGDWYLGQTTAGQPADSPCLDSGGEAAGLICYDDGSGTVCLDELTTRTDRGLDAGTVDMGYHYPPAGSVTARLECSPSSGVLPFITSMEVELANRFVDQRRRIAGRIDIELANGDLVTNWRAGYTNVNGGESYVSSWNQNIPALLSLVGYNLFTVQAMDVTPAPWNQPPYPPAGDILMDNCTVRGLKP